MTNAQVADKALTMLQGMMQSLQSTVTHYAPTAYTALLGVTQLNCIGQLVVGGLSILTAVGLTFTCIGFTKAYSYYDRRTSDNDEALQVLCAVGAVPSAVVSVVSYVCGFCEVLDWWAWIGAFNPQLYLAHQIVQKALGQ